MKTRKLFSRGLAVALSVLMLLGAAPTPALAANDGVMPLGDTGESSGIVLNKTADLADDGTYTINLEAYVTGKVVTQIERKTKPTDIVLVLDCSGSMEWNMSGMPDGTYSKALALTNRDAYEGAYYYKMDGNYYPVTVKYGSTGTVEHYEDVKGNICYESAVSYTWTDSKGIAHEAESPYLKSTLITLTREKQNGLNRYRYKRDDNGTTIGSYGDAAEARVAVRNAFAEYTTQFYNGDTYTAAAYQGVAPVYAHTYEYYYTNEEGRLIPLPTMGTSNDSPCPYTLYEGGSRVASRMEVLQYAANQFIESVAADAREDAEHRVAVVSFASSAEDKSEGLRYVRAEKSALETAVNGLEAVGATRADLGLSMAEGILNGRTDVEKSERDTIVVFFSDGAPTSSSSFEDEVAANAIRYAKELKNGEKMTDPKQGGNSGAQPTGEKLGYTAKVYSIAVFPGASPTGPANIQNDSTQTIDGNSGQPSEERINDFMHMVSSNYPQARGENQSAFLNRRPWEYFREVGSMMNGYYMAADDAASLNHVFANITQSMHETVATVDLDETAVLKDVLSIEFILPEGYDPNAQISVSTADYQGNGVWSAAEKLSGAGVAVNDRTIDVTGFDYSSYPVAEATSSTNATGKKLIVTIEGVEAQPAAATGDPVDTNESTSGIWSVVEGETVQVAAFERPYVTIANETFVLDYAKGVTVDSFGPASVIHLDADGMNWFNTAAPNKTVNQTTKYGTLTATLTGVTYTPNTMSWDDYDSFYAFGKDAEGKNAWTKVSFIPANNVYYEDTFVTDSTITGINYDNKWAVAEAEGVNAGEVNVREHGWVTSLADDLQYSDGTSASADVAGADTRAVATFSFTGTGVDVYSRTNATTGLVRAQLYTGNNTTDAPDLTKVLVVDNLAQSDDYYQIPTVSFSGLEYNTYTVKLTVGAKDGRSTYFLDGIRVYNPLVNADTTVAKAYGDELGATFKEVRDILLDAKTLSVDAGNAEGIVFIDYNPADPDNHTTGPEIGTYKDYGPKNEVYLAAGQAIAFEVADPAEKISVGLKAPSGAATTAQVTNDSATSPITISHASDLYYEITPNSEGFVVIKNTGTNLLSVTKLKTSENAAMEAAEMPAMMAYVEDFDTLPVVAYAITPEIPQLPVTPEVPETPAPGGETEEPAEDKKDDFQWIFEFYFEWLGKNGFLKSLWHR